MFAFILDYLSILPWFPSQWLGLHILQIHGKNNRSLQFVSILHLYYIPYILPFPVQCLLNLNRNRPWEWHKVIQQQCERVGDCKDKWELWKHGLFHTFVFDPIYVQWDISIVVFKHEYELFSLQYLWSAKMASILLFWWICRLNNIKNYMLLKFW